MIIAKEKRKENIAEYLLYMWQVEDLIRSCRLEIETIDKYILSGYGVGEEQYAEIRQWYMDMIEMMKGEGATESGHLQINKNVIIDLTDLHLRLLKEPQESAYIAAYYKALPCIVELRSKAGGEMKGEMETCFEALYGMLLLRLQKKEISTDTANAIHQISILISILADKHKHKDEEE